VKKLLTVLTVLAVLWQAPAHAGAPRQITWDHLVPAGPPIDDPLADLNQDQRVEIELLASIRARKALGIINDVDEQNEFAIEIEHKLKKEGLDIESRVAAYIKLEAEWRKRNAQMVPELDGQMVRIPGYALPLEFDGTAVEEFLLVPYVGACIHVPPPPKNQTVFVRLKQSYTAESLYEPIWITGRMNVQATTKRLTFFDGQADVHAGYTLDAERIEPYKE